MTREQRIDHLVTAEGFTRSEAELIVDATVEAGFIAPNDRECKPGCNLEPGDEENHEAFGGCLDDEDCRELKLMARDYESWAAL